MVLLKLSVRTRGLGVMRCCGGGGWVMKTNSRNSLMRISMRYSSTSASDGIHPESPPIVGVFQSKFTDPYINLGVEDWLLANRANFTHALYLYCNEPSVVIGRSQNPWKECNLELLYKEKIALVRRKSGGGTVFHDLGNSNYFVLMPRDSFKRTTNAEMVKGALVDLGIPAHVTERKDIAVGEHKVSGSAYKLSGNKAYHHGTMLRSANLKILSNALRPTEVEVISKGVDSVRSPVINLDTHLPTITHDLFSNAVVPRFLATYQYPPIDPTIIDQSFLIRHPEILTYANKLKEWDWIYGQTPEFSMKFPILVPPTSDHPSFSLPVKVISKYGKFVSVTLDPLPPSIITPTATTLSDLLTSHLAGKSSPSITIPFTPLYILTPPSPSLLSF